VSPVVAQASIQSLFADTASRVAVSVLAVGALVGLAFALRAAGRRYGEDYSDGDVEAVQAIVFSLVAAGTAWFLIIVWQAANAVAGRFAILDLGVREGALALVAGLTLLVAYTVTRISKGLLKGRDGDVITAHRREVLHLGIQLVVYALAATFVLALAGVDPRDLLVGAGALGLIIGLAARQTVGAVLSGMILLVSRPFEIGDWVVVDDDEGIVTDITLFNTQLRTYDGEYVIIPNDEITRSNVVNRSREGKLRVSVDVGVDYEEDLTHAAEVAERAMRESGASGLLADRESEVVGKRFGDSAVVLTCRFWIDSPTAPRKWEAQTAVIRAVREAFAEEGITIPFPQRELSEREAPEGVDLTPDNEEGTTRNVADGTNGSPDGED